MMPLWLPLLPGCEVMPPLSPEREVVPLWLPLLPEAAPIVSRHGAAPQMSPGQAIAPPVELRLAAALRLS